MTGYKVTAFDLKLALLRYFRFERQWVCVDECRGADVIADTGKDIIEVEVKVSGYDLARGEDKKHRKHDNYKVGRGLANKFYFCVPESLVAAAVGVCEKLNPKYGIVAFNSCVFERHIQWGWGAPHDRCLRMARIGKKLRESYTSHQKAIAMRTSSKIVTLMETEFRNQLQNSKEIKDVQETDNCTKV